MTPFAAGVINGALYLTAVFVAGLVGHHRISMILAIVAMGLTFLCYLVQCIQAKPIYSVMLCFASIWVGFIAGVGLLI